MTRDRQAALSPTATSQQQQQQQQQQLSADFRLIDTAELGGFFTGYLLALFDLIENQFYGPTR